MYRILLILIFLVSLSLGQYSDYLNYKGFTTTKPDGVGGWIDTEGLQLLVFPSQTFGLSTGNKRPPTLSYESEYITNYDFHDRTMELGTGLGHYIFTDYSAEDDNVYMGSERSGSEVINFDLNNASGYSLAGEAEILDGNILHVGDGASAGWLDTQTGDNLNIGDWVLIEYTVPSGYTQTGTLSISSASFTGVTATISTALGDHQYILSGTNNDYVRFYAGGGEEFYITNLKVTKLPANSLAPSGFSDGFEDEFLGSGELGSELMTFATYLGDQIPYSNNTFVTADDVGTLTMVDNEAGTYSNLDAAGGMTSSIRYKYGNTYKVVASVRSTWASSTLDIYNGTAYEHGHIGSDWSEVTVTFTVTGTGNPLIRLRFNGTPTAGETIEIRSLSVKLVTPEHPAYENGGALLFNGVDEYLDVGTPLLPIAPTTLEDFTIEAWIKFNTTSGTDPIIAQHGTSSNRWSFYLVNGQTLWFFASDGVNSMSISKSGLTINDGEWHHVAISRTTSAVDFYIDGVAQSATVSSNGNGTYGAGINTRIGANNLDYFNGYIGEVRITSDALSAVEIGGEYFYAKEWRNYNPAADYISAATRYDDFTLRVHRTAGGANLIAQDVDNSSADGSCYKMSSTYRRLTASTTTLQLRASTNYYSLATALDAYRESYIYTFDRMLLMMMYGSVQDRSSQVQYFSSKRIANQVLGDTVAYDVSGNELNGAFAGNMEDSQIEHPYAYQFDGVDDLISFGTDTTLSMGISDIFLSFWFRTSNAATDFNQLIARYKDTTERWYIRTLADDVYWYVECNNVPTSTQTSTNCIIDNTWQHLAVGFDRDVGSYLFINGVYEPFDDLLPNPNTDAGNDDDFRVGSASGQSAEIGILTWYKFPKEKVFNDFQQLALDQYNKTQHLYEDK